MANIKSRFANSSRKVDEKSTKTNMKSKPLTHSSTINRTQIKLNRKTDIHEESEAKKYVHKLSLNLDAEHSEGLNATVKHNSRYKMVRDAGFFTQRRYDEIVPLKTSK